MIMELSKKFQDKTFLLRTIASLLICIFDIVVFIHNTTTQLLF